MSESENSEILSQLIASRDAGGNALMLVFDNGPVYVGLEGDTMVIVPPERTIFDGALGLRYAPEE